MISFERLFIYTENVNLSYIAQICLGTNKLLKDISNVINL